MIQSMVEWDHSQTWDVVSFAPKDGRVAGELEVVVDFDKEEYKLLRENEIGGRRVFPQAFYIVSSNLARSEGAGRKLKRKIVSRVSVLIMEDNRQVAEQTNDRFSADNREYILRSRNFHSC